MAVNVIPICVVEINLSGWLARSKASFARLSPLFACASSLTLRDETSAISTIEKTPFNIIRQELLKCQS